MAQRKSPAKSKTPSEPRPAGRMPIAKSLAAFAGRMGAASSVKRGAILVRCTDSEEEYVLDRSGKDAKVSKGASASGVPVLVRVAGPSGVLASIMSGQKEASRAFIAGGLQVSGDLGYLEALLKEMGLLNCQ